MSPAEFGVNFFIAMFALIVALDLPTAAEAEALVDRLGDQVCFYKVGLELMATEGMALARRLTASCGLEITPSKPASTAWRTRRSTSSDAVSP